MLYIALAHGKGEGWYVNVLTFLGVAVGLFAIVCLAVFGDAHTTRRKLPAYTAFVLSLLATTLLFAAYGRFFAAAGWGLWLLVELIEVRRREEKKPPTEVSSRVAPALFMKDGRYKMSMPFTRYSHEVVDLCAVEGGRSEAEQLALQALTERIAQAVSLPAVMKQ
jgi:hypothetical protein